MELNLGKTPSPAIIGRGLSLFLIVTVNVSCMLDDDTPYIAPNISSVCAENRVHASLQENADLLRADCIEVSDELKDPNLSAVTREYGSTIIKTSILPLQSTREEAFVRPWSSWWYPKIEDSFFLNGEKSILGKFDRYRQSVYENSGTPYPGDSRLYEEKMYSKKVLSWEGLCDAWSMAAMVVPEPIRHVRVNSGFTSYEFSPSELKALVLKTFEAVDDHQLKYYGQKFTGDDKGWIYPDIFPDQFHRLIEVSIFQKHKGFIMDHDPGPQVWNIPVYKANYILEKIAEKPNAVFVKMWVYSAEPALPENREILGIREAVREYQYVLQGKRDQEGNLVIDSGYWVKGKNGIDSRHDHPDYLIEIINPKELKRKSYNPFIESDIVDKLLNQ